jgi:hypothetical protein
MFKYSEIISETEIKCHLDFIMPYFHQFIYINDKQDRLIEVFSDDRCFIYKAEKKEGTHVKWQLIKKMMDYPTRYGRYFSLEYFSPDFSRFLDYDKQQDVFNIKDTYLGTVIATIP